ncbi:B-box zinc finger protein 21 [Abeliophyllum distichum]|uniref:B-box zinc finger protein 21 n=1 Tax=Abeliophyllum distichum TaxID=126358 RepID=A0ABD1TK73_9LAMI
MKIQCDVCDKDEAILFCVADEAALCNACDHRVHHANKLAGKHERFSLLQPSPKQAPLCDICQERRALLFCQQDRAILCKECDESIHSANEHTSKHNRFLLTGVKLSAISVLYSSTPISTTSAPTNINSQNSRNKSPSLPSTKPHSTTTTSTDETATPPPPPPPAAAAANDNQNSQLLVNGGHNFSTSSISEYLIEMLPGWHVEDLLDSSSAYDGLCKGAENDMFPFSGADIEGNLSGLSPENMGSWVPQSPCLHQTQNQLYPPLHMAFWDPNSNGIKESKEVTNIKSSRMWSDDNSFAVPQISPHSKKSTTFW